ncbi:MAG: hypothetical protein EXX96DRAFT_497341, partial [Benjaminiella poitrasii]
MNQNKEYKMDEVEAMQFVADSWIKVKTLTTTNCWKRTGILRMNNTDEIQDVSFTNEELSLEIDIVQNLNEVVPELPGNSMIVEGRYLVSNVNQLSLEADEDELVVTQPSETFTITDEAENDLNEIESEQEVIVTKQMRSVLKQAYELILRQHLPEDGIDEILLKRIK